MKIGVAEAYSWGRVGNNWEGLMVVLFGGHEYGSPCSVVWV